MKDKNKEALQNNGLNQMLVRIAQHYWHVVEERTPGIPPKEAAPLSIVSIVRDDTGRDRDVRISFVVGPAEAKK